ncbi:unnamed protein product [Anisakis simplex]|uniref:ADP-ribosylhydrolase ARH3 n=1 Tax=Anisakis simplex TaxID=6269 RepID=A0A0M3JZA0_ANISI|nr:unnamed protein product [Anisakis simplex]
MNRNKAIGCLYGQLIGDALGTRYEFLSAVNTQAKIKKDLDSKQQFLPILGGGPFKMTPGQITDDSEMAFSLAASLCRCKSFNAPDVACAYVAWQQSTPPDIGVATRNALEIKSRLPSNWIDTLDAKAKCAVHKEVIENVRQHNADSASNGCLMRISPIAIASAHLSVDKMKEMVREDCILTHCAPVCIDAVTAYVAAVRELINDRTPLEAFKAAVEISQNDTVKDILRCAKREAIPVKARGVLINGDTKMMGYIGVALQSAFHELLNAPSFYTGLLNAVSRGGDTDTNGCIVAAMLGRSFLELL